jgi:hypothetical protein
MRMAVMAFSDRLRALERWYPSACGDSGGSAISPAGATSGPSAGETTGVGTTERVAEDMGLSWPKTTPPPAGSPSTSMSCRSDGRRAPSS